MLDQSRALLLISLDCFCAYVAGYRGKVSFTYILPPRHRVVLDCFAYSRNFSPFISILFPQHGVTWHCPEPYQSNPTKPSSYFSTFSCVPHGASISWLPQYLLRNKNPEAPHYAVSPSSTFLLLSRIFSWTPSAHVLPVMWETKFYTHIKTRKIIFLCTLVHLFLDSIKEDILGIICWLQSAETCTNYFTSINGDL
jgi:hypothetical protein